MQNADIIPYYKAIYESGSYDVETKVVINNVEYFESNLYSVQTFRACFDEATPTGGNAYCGRVELTMDLPPETIPKSAQIKLFVRIKNSYLVSGWLPKGVFYIAQREIDKDTGRLSIVGYDDMYKADRKYPTSALVWSDTSPNARAVLDEIASFIGVQLDNRTKSAIPAGNRYIVQFPAQFTMRDVLGSIAAMFGGNFCMSDDGKLLFVGIADLPAETNYLINEIGNYITVGNLRILIA